MKLSYGFIQTFLRKRLRNDTVYRMLRRVLVTLQYYLRRADEPELRAFKIVNRADGNALLLDIGANGGQTAVAFGFICPQCRILSFEPNPSLWSELEFIRKLLGDRFNFERWGVGDTKGQIDFHIPYVGALPVTTQASVVRDKVERAAQHLEERLGEAVEVRTINVDIVRIDDLEYDVAGIKIDVEGHEFAALSGMADTLREQQPLLMLEKNTNDAQCKEMLASFGYEFFEFDPAAQVYINGTVDGMRNWFAVPPKLRETFMRELPVAS